MPGERILRLSPAARSAIEEEARARYPEECCGGLLGREGEDGSRGVVRAVPGRNERDDERRRRYLLGPHEVLRMEDEAEERGLELLGFFHSHPDHPAVPSEHDREHAWPFYSYVIVSVTDGAAERIRSWRLDDERSGFEEEEVDVMEGAMEDR